MGKFKNEVVDHVWLFGGILLSLLAGKTIAGEMSYFDCVLGIIFMTAGAFALIKYGQRTMKNE